MIDDRPVLPHPDARLAPRDSIFLGAQVERDQGLVEGRIRNISATGALLEISASLELNETLRLRFRGVDDVQATVVRLTARGGGVRFATPIDPAVCRQSVLPPKPEWTQDYVLCLREGYQQSRWQSDGAALRRPALSTPETPRPGS